MSISSNNTESQTTEKTWTQEFAAAWFETGDWSSGLQFKPHESVNVAQFAAQFHKHPKWWNAAFDYLRETDLGNLAPGNYPIDGENVFAIVAENPKKDFDQTKWESHRRYQDIQMVISGAEKMGIAPISTLEPIENYDDESDLIFYKADGAGKIYTANPGTFFIFFPHDGHRPDIKIVGIERDKKIVIKVRVD